MKTCMTELLEELSKISENYYIDFCKNESKIIDNIYEIISDKYLAIEKQQIIDFANKCMLVRDVDLDGNIIFCFDPAELFDVTFTTNKETLK